MIKIKITKLKKDKRKSEKNQDFFERKYEKNI